MTARPTTPEDRAARAGGPIVGRNVRIAGRRTSMRLEPEMWSALREICQLERTTIGGLCARVAADKSGEVSLSSAVRVYVMSYFREAATPEGHRRAGHGGAAKKGGVASGSAGFRGEQREMAEPS